MTYKIKYLGREIELPDVRDLLKHMLGETECYPSKKNCHCCNENANKNMTKRYYPDDLDWFGYEGHLEFYLASKNKKPL